MLQLSRLHFGCWSSTHRHTHTRTSLVSGQVICLSDSKLCLTRSLTSSFFSITAEHFQVQVREWHPPGRAPQAGVVRWQAGQLHLLHLQRQGDGRPALPGVVAEGKRLHLRPLATRTHATGQSGCSSRISESLPHLESCSAIHVWMIDLKWKLAVQSDYQASLSQADSHSSVVPFLQYCRCEVYHRRTIHMLVNKENMKCTLWKNVATIACSKYQCLTFAETLSS